MGERRKWKEGGMRGRQGGERREEGEGREERSKRKGYIAPRDEDLPWSYCSCY